MSPTPDKELNPEALDAALGRAEAEGEQSLPESTARLYALAEPQGEEDGLYRREIGDLIRDHRHELRNWRNARRVALALSTFVILSTGLSVRWLLTDPRGHVVFLAVGSDSVKIAVVAGCLALVFGLTAILLRGAFTPGKTDMLPSAMPEWIKIATESVGGLFKGH